MADFFTLSFKFGVTSGGESVEMEGSVTLHQPPDERSLRTALSHAAHSGYGRLWEQLQLKPAEEKETA